MGAVVKVYIGKTALNMHSFLAALVIWEGRPPLFWPERSLTPVRIHRWQVD